MALSKSKIALLVVILLEAAIISGLFLYAASLRKGFYEVDELTFRIAEKRQMGIYIRGYGMRMIYAFFTDEHGLAQVSYEDFCKYEVGDVYTWHSLS